MCRLGRPSEFYYENSITDSFPRSLLLFAGSQPETSLQEKVVYRGSRIRMFSRLTATNVYPAVCYSSRATGCDNLTNISKEIKALKENAYLLSVAAVNAQFN